MVARRSRTRGRLCRDGTGPPVVTDGPRALLAAVVGYTNLHVG